jgi:GBP family porin
MLAKIKTSLQRTIGVTAFLLMTTIIGSHAAYAQSSVTLYGLLSEGVSYVSNEGGKSNVKLLAGTDQNNRIGFRGVEDLGSGLKALFVLENGFDPTTGAFQQGGRLFGRQAFVGLSSATYGTVTLGRQYDVVFDDIALYELAVGTAPGLGVNIGDNDNAYDSFRYNNSIKYVSPVIEGLQGEVMYAMSNVSQWALNRSFGAGLSWDSKKNFKFGLMYLDINRPGVGGNANGAVTNDYVGAPFVLFHTSPLNSNVGVERQQVFGGGAQYSFSALRLSTMVTDVRYDYLDHTSLHLTNFDFSAAYYLTPSLEVTGGYIYTAGRYGGFSAASPHWHEAQVGIDYFLSKRTDIYLYGDFTKSHAGEAVTYLFNPSSSDNQTVVVAGIRHKF